MTYNVFWWDVKPYSTNLASLSSIRLGCCYRFVCYLSTRSEQYRTAANVTLKKCTVSKKIDVLASLLLVAV